MIDLQVVIDRITTETIYPAKQLKSREVDLQDSTELPIVSVGYANITSKNPHAPIESTLFNTAGEDLVQSFEIHITCPIADFSVIWKTIYSKLIGYNPVATEQYHSGFTYARGGVMGVANGKQWHVDIWNIGFPTTTPLI